MTSEYKFLSDYAEIKGGKRLPKGKNLISTPTDHPYIRVRDLGSDKVLELTTDYEYVDDDTQSVISRYTVNSGDVIISIVGTIGLVGKIGVSLNGANLTENCAKIVNLHGLNADYLYYYLTSVNGQNAISAGTVGAVQPKLPLKSIQALPIPVMSIGEQTAIAETLSALDAQIAENKKINHHLEQMAQAIFKSWFVDFKSFGGVMPDDWRDGTLSEIASVTMGQSPDGSSYNEDGIGAVFYQGRTDFGSRFPTQRLFTTQPKRMASEGDVLLSVRAPVGDLNVATEPCCLGRGLAGIQSNNGNQSFILYTMFALRQQLDMFNGEGTVFGSINKKDVADLPIVIPSDEVIYQFESLVSPMDTAIKNNYDEICHLQAIRDTLLPRLISGELSVTDITAK